MRHNLFLISLTCMMSSCVTDSSDGAGASDTSIKYLLTSKPALVCYSLVVGTSIGMLLVRRKGKHDISTRKKPAGATQRQFGEDHEEELEKKYYCLEVELKKKQDKNQELERELAECRLLFNKGIREAGNIQQETENYNAVNHNMNSEASVTIALYFLQPSSEGLFKEAGRIDNAAEALYELNYQSSDPEEATLRFIDTPGNVFLAIQNEPTWILVACERSNVPLENTSSIQTDIPGRAVLKNGEWKIVQKAKITYIC